MEIQAYLTNLRESKYVIGSELDVEDSARRMSKESGRDVRVYRLSYVMSTGATPDGA